MSQTPLQILQSYLPDPVLQQIAAGQEPKMAPAYDLFSAAVVLVDISGFTRLTEQLAAHGAVGAEELSRVLNLYFDKMIGLVTAHNGQVMQFIGDALVVAWPMTAEMALPEAVQRALACCWQLLAELNGYAVQPGIELYIKCLVGAGDVLATSVGGQRSRWQYLLTGPVVGQIAQLSPWAAAGQVLLAPAVWQLVGKWAQGEMLAGDVVRLTGVEGLRPLPQPAPVVLPSDREPLVRRYVSTIVQEHLSVLQHGWLAELRRLTILFLNVHVDANQPDGLAQLQEVGTAVQKVLYRYEGNWTRIVEDEKGTYLLMVLGLPPFTHEDDPLRGVQVALDLNQTFARLGVTGALGIATGRVFCGEQGNHLRREYTFLGNPVNLAARLMSAANEMVGEERPLAVLCDDGTYQLTQDEMRYRPMSPMQLKGKALPVAVYAPVEAAATGFRALPGGGMPLVGRTAEVALLRQQVALLQEQQQRGVVVIEGEAGIGKSHLARVVLEEGRALGVMCWEVEANAIEQTTPYHVWRSLLWQLLGLEGLTAAQVTAQRIAAVLAEWGVEEQWQPLLNPLLPLNLPETAVTEQITEENRAENTRDVMLNLLRQKQDGQPLVLLVEDIQWLDSASWKLLLAVRHLLRPLLMVLTGRQEGGQYQAALPDEALGLLADAATMRLTLQPLAREEALTLVRQRLGVEALPDVVANFIDRTAEGHPFFSEEVAYALRDEGVIVVENGRCTVPSTVGDLQHIQFPSTIEGVITARISRLSTEQQLTVKVASVVGRVFALNVLAYIYPITEHRDEVSHYVAVLDRLNITPLYERDPELQYIFRHMLSREVAYNLLLYAQRRQLHQAAGTLYEQLFAPDLSVHYALLAYHWHTAAALEPGDDTAVQKALDYLDKAGQQALRNGVMQEAAHFFGDLLALVAKLPPNGAVRQAITPLQEAKWNRYMGQASLQSGRAEVARGHLEQALRLLDFSVHQTVGRLGMATAGQYGVQALHRFFPQRYLHSRADDSERLVTAAAVYDYLVEIHFNASEPLAATYYAICRLNFAELAAPSPQLGAYGGIAMTMGLLTLGRLADRYAALALAAVAEMDDLPTRGLTMVRVGAQFVPYCQWEEARALAVEAWQIAEQLNDAQLGATVAGLGGGVERYTGHYTESEWYARQGLAYSRRSGNTLHDSWNLKQLAEAALLRGQLAEAVRLGEETMAVLREAPNDLVKISMYGVLALAHWRLGAGDVAYATAVEGLTMIRATQPIAFISHSGHCYVPEALLRLAADGYKPSVPLTGTEDLAQQGAVALKALGAYARSFPIGRPSLWLCRGLLAWGQGKPKKALAAWRKGIGMAEKLRMPYEQGVLWREVGSRLALGDGERPLALEKAAQLFTELGCAYDLALVEEERGRRGEEEKGSG